MSRWYRAYEGTVTDAKLAEAAVIAEVSRSVAVATWHYLLESAATKNNCGSFDVTPRRAAVALCEPAERMEALFAAFAELLLVADGAITAWKKRQFQTGADPNPETYVYVAGTDWGRAVKIGFSKNPWARAKELQTGNAAKVEILAHFKCAANSEREIHNLLAKQRHAGEWFNLSVEIIAIIQQSAADTITYEDLLRRLRRLRSTTSPDIAETEPETERESSKDDSPSDDEPSLRPEHVFEFYQKLAAQLGRPVPRDFTPERRSLTRGRVSQYPLEDFHTVIAKCRGSPFLRGDKGRTPLTFDWLMKKQNFQKVLEGNYDA